MLESKLDVVVGIRKVVVFIFWCNFVEKMIIDLSNDIFGLFLLFRLNVWIEPVVSGVI